MQLRKNNDNYTWLKPDCKSQITFNYGSDGKPLDIAKIVCSTQHSADVEIEFLRQEGGPDGDTGLTGRKIIVDTYGGAAPHGGGAFSGKDFTKVDRSAAYAARAIAKILLQENNFQEVLVQLSYAIGVKEPTSITIWTDKRINYVIAEEVKLKMDLTPLAIIEKFDLVNFDMRKTTNYGHFGRIDLPWEIAQWD